MGAVQTQLWQSEVQRRDHGPPQIAVIKRAGDDA
jgi:hypothetical protein